MSIFIEKFGLVKIFYLSTCINIPYKLWSVRTNWKCCNFLLIFCSISVDIKTQRSQRISIFKIFVSHSTLLQSFIRVLSCAGKFNNSISKMVKIQPNNNNIVMKFIIWMVPSIHFTDSSDRNNLRRSNELPEISKRNLGQFYSKLLVHQIFCFHLQNRKGTYLKKYEFILLQLCPRLDIRYHLTFQKTTSCSLHRPGGYKVILKSWWLRYLLFPVDCPSPAFVIVLVCFAALDTPFPFVILSSLLF